MCVFTEITEEDLTDIDKDFDSLSSFIPPEAADPTMAQVKQKVLKDSSLTSVLR